MVWWKHIGNTFLHTWCLEMHWDGINQVKLTFDEKLQVVASFRGDGQLDTL